MKVGADEVFRTMMMPLDDVYRVAFSSISTLEYRTASTVEGAERVASLGLGLSAGHLRYVSGRLLVVEESRASEKAQPPTQSVSIT